MIGLLFSFLHFPPAFALVAILATQNVLIRPRITLSSLHPAANLDRAYGASAA